MKQAGMILTLKLRDEDAGGDGREQTLKISLRLDGQPQASDLGAMFADAYKAAKSRLIGDARSVLMSLEETLVEESP